MKNDNFNIMTNIKIIENLKADLLCTIGDLFKLLARGSNVVQHSILECISDGIIILYLLGKKLGYNYKEIDESMETKLKVGISDEDIMEKQSKDLSNLYTHIKHRPWINNK